MYFISDREGIDRHVLTPWYPTNVINNEQVIYTSMNPWYPIGTVVFGSSSDGSSSDGSSSDGSDEGEETGNTEELTQNDPLIDSSEKTYSVSEINGFSDKLLMVDSSPIIPYVTAGTPWSFTYMKATTTCPFNVLGGSNITVSTTIDENTTITTTYNVLVTRTKANIWTITIQANSVDNNTLQGGFVTIELPSSADSNVSIPITLYINDYKETQTDP